MLGAFVHAQAGVVFAPVSDTSVTGIAQVLYDELLDAAWTRVLVGPIDRERHRGPFSIDSVAGTLALAPVDLIVLQQEANRAELYPLADDVDELVQRPLALLAADALSTLLSLARALARAIGKPELATREELDRLIAEEIDLKDLGGDPTEHGYLVEAVEQIGRITTETINHGVKHFGPIVIHVPVIIAITDVLSQTIALLVDLIDSEDEDEDEA